MLMGLLCCLLSGCGVVRQIEQLNRSELARAELRKITDQLEESETPKHSLRILYLSDVDSLHTEPLVKLMGAWAPESEEALLVARLLGDGGPLIRYGHTPEDQAQGFLLIGNLKEAARIAPHHAPTMAIIYLANGDTLRAAGALKEVMQSKEEERMTRLNAARSLWQIAPRSEEALLMMMQLTANPWEQFVASQWLDFYAGRALTYDPQNGRERIFVQYLETLRRGESTAKQSSQRTIWEKIAEPEWQQYIPTEKARRLRDACLREEDYAGALLWHQQLPKAEQRQYPYILLSEYAVEIQAMATFEKEEASAPIQTPEIVIGWHPPLDNTFRGRWGGVENRDNWALGTWSQYFGSHPRSKSGLSPAEYQRLRQRLRQMIMVGEAQE